MSQVLKGIVATVLLTLSLHTMMGSVGVNTGDYPSLHGVEGGFTAIVLAMLSMSIYIWAFLRR